MQFNLNLYEIILGCRCPPKEGKTRRRDDNSGDDSLKNLRGTLLAI